MLEVASQFGFTSPVTTHKSCRHYVASQMVREGVSLYEVQKILGHGSLAVTQRYAHLAPDHLRSAIEKLEDDSPSIAKENNLPKTGSTE